MGADQFRQTTERQVSRVRRDYKAWVADETLEDYALRYAARGFRKWSVFRVANTAFGAVSFLAIEAIGATMALQYGFINTFWAALAISAIVFLTGLPIAWYAARYNLDMDLLTRGAGFGYLGSTITSLIYACFTFLLFAIEAAIMAQALYLFLGMPLWIAYLLSALVVLPLVGRGITRVNRLQTWSQPLWLALLLLPYLLVFWQQPGILGQLETVGPHGGQFNLLAFGAATSVGLAFVTQIGEQVDFLRFMPERTPANRRRWLAGVLIAGPGWVLLGSLKLLGGALLAYLAMRAGFSLKQATQPAVMYQVGYQHVFDSPLLVAITVTLFVVVSQIKINMTNAYAGSLAWSNLFARLTHSHPGRVVWLVFNVVIAYLLMQMGIINALGHVLGLYANIAISWVGALVADLLINKPLGLSPQGIQFMRAHLYDINPVGTGALLLASVLSSAAFGGLFGETAQAFSALIALVTALLTAPLIAWLTRGRYYLAREPDHPHGEHATCSVCEKTYESADMTHCPAYGGSICSLCCTLDGRCQDLCRPGASAGDQYLAAVRRLLPAGLSRGVNTRLGYYVLLTGGAALLLGGILWLFYREQVGVGLDALELAGLRGVLDQLYLAIMLLIGVGAWWLVLTLESRYVAQDESNRQTHLLLTEIEAHRQTDAQLQESIEVAERANQAKSRYLTGISHELRTPLNSILGYAQVVEHDPSVPETRREAMRVIRRSGEHMVSLLDGLLDMSRIEAGKLSIDAHEIRFPQFVEQIADMFRPQAREKGIAFHYETVGGLPAQVRVDKKRLGQILINILGNAVKFTERGGVTLRITHRSDMTRFDVEDTGVGISEADRQRIFLPFERGDHGSRKTPGGAGLGLTIASMLVTLMGGELSVTSRSGGGSRFSLQLYLPATHGAALSEHLLPPANINGYEGPRRRILLVDDEWVDREFMHSVLAPLGFQLEQAGSGVEALRKVSSFRPDLILLDLNMGDIDGWETSRLLRANRLSDAPILLVSADVSERGRDNTAGIGQRDFIAKPVDIEQLLSRIAYQLQLQWSLRDTPPDSDKPASGSAVMASGDAGLRIPPAGVISELHELGVIGDVDGILERLCSLQDATPEYALFADRLRTLINNFRLDDYLSTLESAGEHHGRHS